MLILLSILANVAVAFALVRLGQPDAALPLMMALNGAAAAALRFSGGRFRTWLDARSRKDTVYRLGASLAGIPAWLALYLGLGAQPAIALGFLCVSFFWAVASGLALYRPEAEKA